MKRNKLGVFHAERCSIVNDETVYTSAAKLLEAVLGPHRHSWCRDQRDVTNTRRCWCGSVMKGDE